jgi:hypothetical protein
LFDPTVNLDHDRVRMDMIGLLAKIPGTRVRIQDPGSRIQELESGSFRAENWGRWLFALFLAAFKGTATPHLNIRNVGMLI